MREADIRPADLLAEYLRLSALDAERFFSDRALLSHRMCPGCGGDRPKPAYVKNGFDLVHCASCKTLYVTPCPTAAQLSPFYTDSPSTRYWSTVFFPAVAEARRGRIFRPRAERVLALAADSGIDLGRICEVGAGASIFLEEIRALNPGASVRAVEPGIELARICRAKNFETFEGFAEQAAGDMAWAGQADLVVCFEVIEHIPETVEFVKSLAALAKPGGMILMSGLCGDGFDIQLLEAKSQAVAPPHHLTFLSRKGAAALMANAGLVDARVITPGELDVDIVRNALLANPHSVSEPFLRNLILEGDDASRAAFQSFLRENGLSSHMWVYARKPA